MLSVELSSTICLLHLFNSLVCKISFSFQQNDVCCTCSGCHVVEQQQEKNGKEENFIIWFNDDDDDDDDGGSGDGGR